jgi:hypothetical protein
MNKVLLSQLVHKIEEFYFEGVGIPGRGLQTKKRGKELGGASRDRTDGLVVANDALSQLSYSPTWMGTLRTS